MLEQRADARRRLTRSADDLTPTESDRVPSVDGRLEVAVKISVASPRRVVEEPAVELDDQPERVVHDVAVDRSPRRQSGRLSAWARQTVRSLDPGQVAMFEHRAGPAPDITQYRRYEVPATDPSPAGQCVGEAPDGGPPTLHNVCEDRDRSEVIGRLGREVECSVLDAESGRSQIPADPGSHVGRPVDDDASRGADWSVPVYRNVDWFVIGSIAAAGPVGRTECRAVAKRRRPGVHHCCPRTLDPGQRARVIDVHTRMDWCPLATTDAPSDVVRPAASSKYLAPGDHTCLIA